MNEKTDQLAQGVIFGFLGMLGFSGTLVATRFTVMSFSPLTITCARIVIAAVLAMAALCLLRKTRLPDRQYIPSIIWSGLGLAVGFPYFVALALQSVPAVHGAVAVGLSPAATAIIASVRLKERPRPLFWLASVVGFAGVFYYAWDAGGGQLVLADLWLLFALICVGSAYVEGGRVSVYIGATMTLCWSMIALAPIALLTLIWDTREINWTNVALGSWIGIAYLGLVSMFLASIFWYRGLAAGGVARIGQLNLLVPILALAWSGIFLQEMITVTAVVCAIVVCLAMIICLRSKSSK